MDWGAFQVKDENAVVIPKRWLHIHHYEALNLLFRIENALRVFVFCILKTESGANWQNTQVSTAEGSQNSISGIAKQRLAQQRDFGYLGYSTNNPLMFLTSGELIHLVFSDGSWPKFAKYFPGKKEILRNKLEEIGSIRNSLAHFRPLRPDDIDVLKQNAKHALGGVELCLERIVSTDTNVPTNLQSAWFNALRTMGTSHCETRFLESSDGNWIRVVLKYSAHTLNPPDSLRDWYRYNVLNVSTPAILEQFKDLAANVLFAREQALHMKMPADGHAKYRKDLSFTFSAKTLESEFLAIKKVFEELLTMIESEIDLLVQDQLARGKLISQKSVYARKGEGDKAAWSMGASDLEIDVSDRTLPEYWGKVGAWSSFLDSAQRYPWMAADISDDDFPF